MLMKRTTIELLFYEYFQTSYFSEVKKKFTTKIGKLEDSRVFMYHLIIPKEIVLFYKENNQKRLMCQVNELEPYSSAIMFAKDEYAYINVNKERMKKLETQVGDTVKVILLPDTSEYGMPLPPAFEEVLIQDTEFKSVFQKLTPGKQRNLIHLVAKLKSQDKRIEKSIIIANYLKRVKGALDFKELNQAFKDGI